MKKIYAILLVLVAALAFAVSVSAYENNTYNMSLQANAVKVKVSVKDYQTLEPIPKVRIGVYGHVHGINATYLLFVTDSNIADGVAEYTEPFTHHTTVDNTANFYHLDNTALSDATDPNGSSHQIGSEAENSFYFLFVGQTDQRWEFRPEGSIGGTGTYYSGKYNHVLSAPAANGRIRNAYDLKNAYANTLTISGIGSYDDVSLDQTGNWFTQGAAMEMVVYVHNNGDTSTAFYDVSKIQNASDFPNQTVSNGQHITRPSATPVCAEHPTWEFVCWTYDGKVFDFDNYTLSHNIGLVPVWRNPNAQGIINFEVYMWDHNAYWLNPVTDHQYPSARPLRGINSWLPLYYYQHNPGWYGYPDNEIAVNKLRFILKSYADDGAGMTGDAHKIPVGRPNTDPDWLNSPTSGAVTNVNGRAQYVITNDQLQYLVIGNCIDTDPDKNCLGELTRDPAIGPEKTMFDWDWFVEGDEEGAGGGLTGVRYIKEGERHQNSGAHISQYNENDVSVISPSMVAEGFEFTFVCHVVPAVSVEFDLNGGAPPAGHALSEYDPQRFKPRNSISGPGEPLAYLATKPVDPVISGGDHFVGWYEVKKDSGGNDITFAPGATQFDFTHNLTYSVTLRAKYAGAVHTARWVPDTWEGTSDTGVIEKDVTYATGDYPTFDSALPTKANAADGCPYYFVGWEVYEVGTPTAKTFLSTSYKYLGFASQTETGGMTTVTNPNNGQVHYVSPYSISNDQVYVAKYKTPTAIKLVKNGLLTGDSAIFEISKSGEATRKVVLTGPSAYVYIIVPAGTWTVTEKTGWSWAYTTSTSQQDVTVVDGQVTTATFTNTPKTSTPAHDEDSVKNTFAK